MDISTSDEDFEEPCPSLLFSCYMPNTPMPFFLCLKHQSESSTKKIENFLERCGAEVIRGQSGPTITDYSVVIVDHDEVKGFCGPAFTLEFIFDCYRLKRLLDISEYRQEATKHIAKDVDCMRVVYFQLRTWTNSFTPEDLLWISENQGYKQHALDPNHTIDCRPQKSMAIEPDIMLSPNDVSESVLNPGLTSQEAKVIQDSEEIDKEEVNVTSNAHQKSPTETSITTSPSVCAVVPHTSHVSQSSVAVAPAVQFSTDDDSLLNAMSLDLQLMSQEAKVIQQRRDMDKEEVNRTSSTLQKNPPKTLNVERFRLGAAVEMALNDELSPDDDSYLHVFPLDLALTPEEAEIIQHKGEVNKENVSEPSTSKQKNPSVTMKNASRSPPAATSSALDEQLGEFNNTSSSEGSPSPPPPPPTKRKIIKVYDFSEDDEIAPVEERRMQSKDYSKHTRALYTKKEKDDILNYITSRYEYSRVKGRELWMEMETRKVCPIRTWQSMKEHFIKKIVPDLDSFSFLTNSMKSKIRKRCT